MSASHSESAAHHAGEHHDHANHSPEHYRKIWLILLVLLVVSVVGPMAEIKVLTLLTAFGIAGVKAFLVIKHFMHLDEELPMVRYLLVIGLALMLMMFAAVGIDVMNHDGARWTNVGAKRAVVEGMLAGDTSGHHEGGASAHGDGAPAHATEAGKGESGKGGEGHPPAAGEGK